MVSFRSGGEQRPRAGEFVRAADEQDRDGGTGTREGDAEVARGGIAVDHRLVGQARVPEVLHARVVEVAPEARVAGSGDVEPEHGAGRGRALAAGGLPVAAGDVPAEYGVVGRGGVAGSEHARGV